MINYFDSEFKEIVNPQDTISYTNNSLEIVATVYKNPDQESCFLVSTSFPWYEPKELKDFGLELWYHGGLTLSIKFNGELYYKDIVSTLMDFEINLPGGTDDMTEEANYLLNKYYYDLKYWYLFYCIKTNYFLGE